MGEDQQKQGTASFTGLLAEPIILHEPAPGREISAEEIAARTEGMADALVVRLNLLFAHYCIGDDYRELAIRLAMDFVPGFEIVSVPYGKKKPGRKGKWNGLVLSVLLEAVQKVQTTRGCSIEKAIREVAKSDALFRSHSAKTLRRRYFEAQAIKVMVRK